ncbi:hypothetical protein GCM10010358_58860 [Streptomyces minutiscleroticus]|uniref:Uncharacterized protein n=1 Tax=Streptomyces minutiscleroticus TaxID=68238 RepID=A0A918NUN7_9ACTN|nr:hypothetical protein GCM10010358_58860 [Streptomyces minutiscleroticus]
MTGNTARGAGIPCHGRGRTEPRNPVGAACRDEPAEFRDAGIRAGVVRRSTGATDVSAALTGIAPDPGGPGQREQAERLLGRVLDGPVAAPGRSTALAPVPRGTGPGYPCRDHSSSDVTQRVGRRCPPGVRGM